MGTLENELAAADRGELDAGRPALPALDPAAQAAAERTALAAAEAQKWIDAAVRYGLIARAMLPAHVQPHWTDERLRAVGAELGNCAQHNGWKFSDAISHPAWKLAAAAFPLAWPLAEPYLMPMIKDAMGKGERDVTPPHTVKTEPEAPPAPPVNKPPTVAPIG